MFFAGEFAEELIQLGQADAQRWLDEHPADPWRVDPLPAWNPTPNGDNPDDAELTGYALRNSGITNISHIAAGGWRP